MVDIQEQVLYLEEPCLNKCPGCFLEREQLMNIDDQMKPLDGKLQTTVTLNDRETSIMRDNLLALKGKFENLHIHCTTKAYQEIKDLHDSFTLSISSVLQNKEVENTHVMLTVYPHDKIDNLKKILSNYIHPDKHNRITINIAKPWDKFNSKQLLELIVRLKKYRFDECTLFHLFGAGICIAEKETAAFFTNQTVNHCPYYLDDNPCEKGIMKQTLMV